MQCIFILSPDLRLNNNNLSGELPSDIEMLSNLGECWCDYQEFVKVAMLFPLTQQFLLLYSLLEAQRQLLDQTDPRCV
jgi:hypothetical protein